ncbi:MAG: GAF domain-containing protein, partial [Spirochaetota bacterium]
MKDAPTPADEALRIRNLRELDVLYSPAEERFDRITRLACRLFNVPIALVSLVAEDCQWFKSRQGLDADQTERRVSFCGHAIMASDVFLVPDATLHPDFSDNPLVTGDPFVRFYAGMPVSTPDGHNLGTLCLIDHMPRTFSEKEKQTLRDLAHWVENELRASGSAPLDEAERRAGLDPLTQSWNGLGMERLIRDELARASQRGSDLSVVGIVVTNYGEIGKE